MTWVTKIGYFGSTGGNWQGSNLAKSNKCADLLENGSFELSHLPDELFTPTADLDSVYDKYGKVLVRAVQSKHIPANLTGSQAELLNSLAKKVGYQCSVIGVKIGFALSPAEDITAVQNIARSRNIRPVKFVITRDDRIWADNTHGALACLLLYGINAVVEDVPHYIVDLRGVEPVIINRPVALIMPSLGISISNALYIQEKLDNGWRPENISFTIGELFETGDYGKNYSQDISPTS